MTTVAMGDQLTLDAVTRCGPDAGSGGADRTPERRLAALVADPNLRHTAARWHAHETVYPGSGAIGVAAGYEVRDRDLCREVAACLADLRAVAPEDEAVGYLGWVLAELGSRDQHRTGGDS